MRIISPLALLLFLSTLVGCQKTTHQEDLPLVEALSEIKLPAGSRLLEHHEDPANTPNWVAKVRLPRGEETAIKTALSEKAAQSLSAKTGNPPPLAPTLGPTLPWWQPQSPLAAQAYYNSHNCTVRAFLCNENGQHILYLEWISPWN